jgi:hypothetical protein
LIKRIPNFEQPEQELSEDLEDDYDGLELEHRKKRYLEVEDEK